MPSPEFHYQGCGEREGERGPHSNNYAVRLLFHLFTVILPNLWVPLKALLQPALFLEDRLMRMDDFLDLLLEAVRFPRRPAGVVT